MSIQLLHIFRNTPLGRETFFQSIYFCKMTGAELVVYIPEHVKFLMYFENDVIQIDLDGSYLTAPDTAVAHASELARAAGIAPKFFSPKNFTASTLPDVPTYFDFMCCPRVISDLSSKIGLGFIGPRVRRITKSAKFPVLIPGSVFKEWKRVCVFFGGSPTALKAVKYGLRISKAAGLPLSVHTQLDHGRTKEYYEELLSGAGMKEAIESRAVEWRIFEDGNFEENLYEIPHDALAIAGAYGHGLIKDMLFGSKMETIQSTIPNTLLIVGPNCTAAR